ncbi:MAG TPA: TetR/AcrR family transcriptional regulator [Thermoleophilaceae bacterium]|nr:TetR/AcrR family transcriptional regulator [Thermoleophilaceae bacterium]
MELAGLIDRALVPPDQADAGDPTRERTLDAAVAEAAAVGLERMTVEDVVRRTGLGRMTVYRRFPRRDDLVEALLLRECRRFLAAVSAALDGDGDPEQRVAAAFTAAMAFVRTHPLTRRAADSEPGAVLDAVAAGDGRILAMGRGFIAAQITAGHPDADPRRVAQVADVVARLFVTYVGIPPEDPDPADEAALADFARRTLVPLLAQAVD